MCVCVCVLLAIAAHSANDKFSWYKYLFVNLVFSHLGFWSGNLFLIAAFPELCLLVPLNNMYCTMHLEITFMHVSVNIFTKIKKIIISLIPLTFV